MLWELLRCAQKPPRGLLSRFAMHTACCHTVPGFTVPGVLCCLWRAECKCRAECTCDARCAGAAILGGACLGHSTAPRPHGPSSSSMRRRDLTLHSPRSLLWGLRPPAGSEFDLVCRRRGSIRHHDNFHMRPAVILYFGRSWTTAGSPWAALACSDSRRPASRSCRAAWSSGARALELRSTRAGEAHFSRVSQALLQS